MFSAQALCTKRPPSPFPNSHHPLHCPPPIRSPTSLPSLNRKPALPHLRPPVPPPRRPKRYTLPAEPPDPLPAIRPRLLERPAPLAHHALDLPSLPPLVSPEPQAQPHPLLIPPLLDAAVHAVPLPRVLPPFPFLARDHRAGEGVRRLQGAADPTCVARCAVMRRCPRGYVGRAVFVCGGAGRWE